MTVRVLLSAKPELEYEKGIRSGPYTTFVCHGLSDVSYTLLSVGRSRVEGSPRVR